MRQVYFWPGSAPDPASGAYDTPPDPLAGPERDTPVPILYPQSTPAASRSRRLQRLDFFALPR